MRCSIRGLNDEEVVKLNRLAAKCGISREEYLRRIVRTHLMESGIKETESKYENLVQIMTEAIHANTEAIEVLVFELKEEREHDTKTFYDIRE